MTMTITRATPSPSPAHVPPVHSDRSQPAKYVLYLLPVSRGLMRGSSLIWQKHLGALGKCSQPPATGSGRPGVDLQTSSTAIIISPGSMFASSGRDLNSNGPSDWHVEPVLGRLRQEKGAHNIARELPHAGVQYTTILCTVHGVVFSLFSPPVLRHTGVRIANCCDFRLSRSEKPLLSQSKLHDFQCVERPSIQEHVARPFTPSRAEQYVVWHHSKAPVHRRVGTCCCGSTKCAWSLGV
ncbi:hypothetical protein BJ875DRAFT_22061 [Amylocarpus encephaloides]|uniref:Uncharacterized protein n=1 Tax=Amylocarpus encephaloides TaxID=45428 RepID=A0A9P8C520_9HELO|nr:hypothetical protein BJ875DRAFT_22061 [Amylocarpus encephaloides]